MLLCMLYPCWPCGSKLSEAPWDLKGECVLLRVVEVESLAAGAGLRRAPAGLPCACNHPGISTNYQHRQRMQAL